MVEEYYSTHSPEYLLTCDACQFTFKGDVTFTEHLKLHSNDSLHTNATYLCCSDSSMCFDEAVQHFAIGHAIEASVEEEYGMEKEQAVKEPTQNAVQTSKKRGRKPGEKLCYVCGKEFKRPSDLVRHEKVHTGERPFACSKCGETFKLKSHLNRHMVTHSTRTKPNMDLVCSVCSKMFLSRTALILHFRIHNDYRPFACEHPGCQEMFRTKKMMYTHYARSHSENAVEKPQKGFCEETRLQLFDLRCQRPRGINQAPRGVSLPASSSDNELYSPMKTGELVISKNSAFSPIQAEPMLMYERQPIETGQVIIRVQLRSVSVGPEHSNLRSQTEIIVPVESMHHHALKETLFSTQFRLGGIPMTLYLIVDPKIVLERLRESPDTNFMMTITPAIGDPQTTREHTPLLFIILPEEAAWGQLPCLFIECFVTQPEATLENRQQFAQSCAPLLNNYNFTF